MESIALSIILASFLATIAVSICLAFDEAFGNWHIKPFPRHRLHKKHKFGKHGKHKIHRRDIKISLFKGKANELKEYEESYSDILANQDLINSCIVNNANININDTKCVSNINTLDSLNNIINFAKPDGKKDITIH